MRNFERRDVLDQLAGQATTPAHRQRLPALRTMHDPIGLAGKPLFFQMVSETLWDPDSDCSNAVGLYESYIRKSEARLEKLEKGIQPEQIADILMANLHAIPPRQKLEVDLIHSFSILQHTKICIPYFFSDLLESQSRSLGV